MFLFKWSKLHRLTALLLICLLLTSKGFCKRIPYGLLDNHPDIGYTSWFTGPLLSPTPINMMPGHPAIQPMIIVGSTYGHYDGDWNVASDANEWFINPSVDFQLGFTKRIGLEIFVPFVVSFKKGATSTSMEDMLMLLGFQIANDIKGTWTPDIRLDWQVTFPTGKYHKLAPHKLGTDLSGQGSFQTGPVFIIHKVFYPGVHPLALKASVGYLFPSNVTVQGRSAYGGSSNTHGTAHPGQTLATFLSAEQSITQKWGWGFDALYVWQDKSTFSGNPGTDANGQPATVGQPHSSQFSLAPFVEYTFSAQAGVLGGAWFTLGGQNANAFASGYFAFLYIF